jgi:hypothetical protein
MVIADKFALEKAKNWVADNVTEETVFYVDVPSYPNQEADSYTVAKRYPGCDDEWTNYTTIHDVIVWDSEIIDKSPHSLVVKVSAIIFKSDGDEETGDTEIYEQDLNYYLRVWEQDIALEAVD